MNRIWHLTSVSGVLALVFVTAFRLFDSLSVPLYALWRKTLAVLNPTVLQIKYRKLVLGIAALCASGFVLWRLSGRRTAS